MPDRATIEAATPHCAVVHGEDAIPCGASLALDGESGGLWVCTACGHVATATDAAMRVELQQANGSAA